MKSQKNQKAPREASSQDHCLDLLKQRGIECTRPILKGILRDRPDALKHGRIVMAVIEQELEKLPPAPADPDNLESKDVLERRKLREQYLRAKSAREREDRMLFHRDDLQREGVRIGAAIGGLLDAIISEIPHWAGLAPAEASHKAKAKAAEIRGLFQTESEKLWGKA